MTPARRLIDGGGLLLAVGLGVWVNHSLGWSMVWTILLAVAVTLVYQVAVVALAYRWRGGRSSRAAH